jgi:hypothetical protein
MKFSVNSAVAVFALLAAGVMAGGVKKALSEEVITNRDVRERLKQTNRIENIDGDDDRSLSHTGGFLYIKDFVSGKGKRTFTGYEIIIIGRVDGEGQKTFINCKQVIVQGDYNGSGNTTFQGVGVIKIKNWKASGTLQYDASSGVPQIEAQSGTGSVTKI